MAINKTAFNIDKVAENKNILSISGSHNLPDKKIRIIQKVNGVITKFRDNSLATLARSENGEMVCEAGPNVGDITVLYSRRHPRQHFDNGILVNAFVFCDTWLSNLQDVFIGRFILAADLSFYDAILTEYKNGKMYALVYNQGTPVHYEQIDAAVISRYDGLGSGFDASKGHYISTQSNGDIVWYFSSPYDDQLYEIHRYSVTNKYTNISCSNSSMHIGMYAKNNGIQAKVRAWYLNAITEGDATDFQERHPFGNVTDVTTIPSGGKVVFACQVVEQLNGRYNTRDVQIYKFVLSLTKRGRYRAFLTRFPNALTKGVNVPLDDVDWTPLAGGSGLRCIDNSSDLITGFVETDSIIIGRSPLEANVPLIDEFIGEKAPEWVVHAETLVIKLYADNAAGSFSGVAGELM